MSFNYLEVAHVVELVRKSLPTRVVGVEVVEFPLLLPVPDLNVALRFADKRMLVFSLKSPWTALFLTQPALWRPSKMTWVSAFGKVQDWALYLKDQELVSIDVQPRDRVVQMRFSNAAELEVELFPARPNWILRAGGEEFRWKEASLRPRGASSGSAAEPVRRESIGYPHYLELRQTALVAALVHRGQTQMQRRLSQLLKIRGQMDVQLEESQKAERYRMSGEQLKSMLHEFPKNHRAKNIGEIELDPKATLADNVSRLFSRYKKLQRTASEVRGRLGMIEAETKKITAIVAKLRAFKREEGEAFATVFERLNEIVPVTTPEPRKLKKTEKKWVESGLPKFESKEGLSIWVGRNHLENEELVIRMARGNDMWMHLKGRPGAHVVIQLPSGKSPSLETLLDGANLVAYYSDVGEGDKVEVDYTYRKNVRRVPGGGDKFLVTYSQNKTLMVKLDTARIQSLTSKRSL